MEVSLWLLDAQKEEIALVLFPALGELGQLQREQRDIGRPQTRLGDGPAHRRPQAVRGPA